MWLLKFPIILGLIFLSTGINSLQITDTDPSQKVLSQMMEVYSDKAMTQKILSFDNVSYVLHKTNSVTDGVSFDPSKSNNVGIAQNYFRDKGTKENDGTYLVRFTNFNKCEVFSLPRPQLNYDVIGIGLVDISGNVTYISISFGTDDKQDKAKLSQDLAGPCGNYIEEMKKKFNDYWAEVQKYWKTKGQVQKLTDEIKSTQDKTKKENDGLSHVLSDKQNFEKNIGDAKTGLKKSQDEIDKIGMQVKDSYKTLNDLKAKKASNEKSLKDQNDNLSKLDSETKQIQAKLDTMNKESDANRHKTKDVIEKMTKVRTEMNEVNDNLTKEKDKMNTHQREAEKVGKEVNDNGVMIAKLSKDLTTNKDNIDKLAIEDLPNQIKKTKNLISDYNKEIGKVTNETDIATEEIKKLDATVKEANDKLAEMLKNPDVIKGAQQSKGLGHQAKLKEVYDELRRTFTIIPDVFMNNLWSFISINHKESLNYLYAIRPSFNGLYDHTYLANDLLLIAKKAKRRKMKRKMKKIKK